MTDDSVAVLSSFRVRAVLVLRVLGLGELASLRLMVRVIPKKPIDTSLDSTVYLANRVRVDGGGSQAIYAFFTMALAKRIGIPYLHRVFQQLEHHDGNESAALNAWNSVFPFNSDFSPPPGTRTFSLGSRWHILRGLLIRGVPIAITSSRIRDVTDSAPQILEDARGELRRVYTPNTMCQRQNTDKFIAFHLRRGDVSASRNAGRYTSCQELETDILAVRRFYSGQKRKVVVVTEPNADLSSLKTDDGFEVLDSSDPLFALHFLTQAAVIVTGTSSFSYLAALISDGQVVYRSFWHPPMKDWVELADIHRLVS